MGGILKLLWLTNIIFGESLSQTTDIEVCNSLKKRGWDIVIVSPHGKNSEALINKHGHTWHGIKSSGIRGLKSFSLDRKIRLNLMDIIKKEDIDFAITNWSTVRGSWKIFEKCKIPWIMDDRSPPVHNDLIGGLQWLHYRMSWKVGSRNAKGFTLITPALKEYISNKYELNHPIALWPSGVAIEKFYKSSWPHDGKIILVYHGLIDRERGINKIIELGDELFKNRINFEILIFGQGNYFKRINELKIKRPWLKILGRQEYEKVPQIIQKCQIGLLPLPDSHQWSFSSPLKLFEYAASGLNVIATDIRCHRDIGERNWLKLVEPEKFSEQACKIIINTVEENWKKNSDKAREDAVENFSWDFVTEQIEKIIQEVLKLNK